MSQIINQLAKIEVSDEVLQRIDAANIYQRFSESYKKLDNLKKFRTDYEEQNALLRWWHNDKLRNAQLDSAEVQAEFSKTIGQLMMLSIMQSKKLSEQQSQLNSQQGKLKSQADGISELAGKLQSQHQVLAKQSVKLKTVVEDYFKSKGLTEEDIQKLTTIVNEVKTTKQAMVREFSLGTQKIEALCESVATQMESVSSRANEQFRLGSEQTRSSIFAMQEETRHDFDALAMKLVAQDIALKNGLDVATEQQSRNQANQIQFEKSISMQVNRVRFVAVFLSGLALFSLLCIAHLMKWI